MPAGGAGPLASLEAQTAASQHLPRALSGGRGIPASSPGTARSNASGAAARASPLPPLHQKFVTPPSIVPATTMPSPAPDLKVPSPYALFRFLVPVFFLALALATGKLPAFLILSSPIVLFFATFIEGSDASLLELVDAFAHGAFIAPPILFALEFTLAVGLAFVVFGVDETYGIVAALDTRSQPELINAHSHAQSALHVPTIDALADRLLASMSERNDRLVFVSAFSFFVASLTEEGLKLFIAVSLSKYQVQTRSLLAIRRLLWICGAVGLGLSFGESVVAVTGLSGDGARGALERVISDVPTHTACAVLSGARLASGRGVVSALAPSFAAHGLFDLCVLTMALLGAPQWISLTVSCLCATVVVRLASLRVLSLERGERFITHTSSEQQV